MITRVFRVRVDKALAHEFEEKFQTISVNVVEKTRGFIDVWIGKPTVWAPDEYVMISRWEDESALIALAGEDWSQPHIPEGMEKIVKECQVHHYESF